MFSLKKDPSDRYLMNIYYKHRAKNFTVRLTSRYLNVNFIIQVCCVFETAGNHAMRVHRMCMEGMYIRKLI